MKPSELFGVIVRTIGLLMSMYGIVQIPTVWIQMFVVSQLHIRVADAGAAQLWALLSAILALVVGLWFLRGAKGLVDFAYESEQTPGRVESPDHRAQKEKS